MKEVIGYAESSNTVLIECPYCGKLHTHGRGWPDAIGNLGHRLSHCLHNDNPGYRIVEVRPLAELPSRTSRTSRTKRCA